MFCIRQILIKRWEYIAAIRHLFIDFKKANDDSVTRKVLCNILIEYGVPVKLVKSITTCLNKTYSRVRVGKHLSYMFPVKNGLKQGDALSSLLCNFAIVYAIRRVNQDGWKLLGAH